MKNEINAKYCRVLSLYSKWTAVLTIGGGGAPSPEKSPLHILNSAIVEKAITFAFHWRKIVVDMLLVNTEAWVGNVLSLSCTVIAMLMCVSSKLENICGFKQACLCLCYKVVRLPIRPILYFFRFSWKHRIGQTQILRRESTHFDFFLICVDRFFCRLWKTLQTLRWPTSKNRSLSLLLKWLLHHNY